MTKKLLVISLIILILTVFTVILGGCACSDEDLKELGYPKVIGDWMASGDGHYWYIVQSPITDRYYEVFREQANIAMYEVTEQEYYDYLGMIERK